MDNEDRKVLFIVNKFSGRGYGATVEQSIVETCERHRITAVFEFTQGAGHATALASEAVAGGYEKVVAVGGDGTVNEVARGLLNSRVPMGILPKGSGNGLARHLRIPTQIPAALQCLFTGSITAIDTFRINGNVSLNVSGIGFDGLIANLFGMDMQRGLKGYARLVLAEFRRFREFEARINADGRELVRKAFVIAIANSSQYGNNARIAPSASVCDGILNLSVLKKIPPYRLDFVYHFFSGSIDQSSYCEVIPVRKAVIELPAPTPFHVDGEAAGKAQRFTVEVVPASLSVVAPTGNI